MHASSVGAAATAVAVPAAASQPQAQAAPLAQVEQGLFELLQQAVQQAAAAASVLMPELAATFAMLPPLDSNRVRQPKLAEVQAHIHVQLWPAACT